MPNLIDALPGLKMPVKEVTETLAHMWDVEPVKPGTGVSDFRASQMNLILHFGLKTSESEAQHAFNVGIKFAQRYPCRIIVLCPEDDDGRKREQLCGKLYSQCFIGRDQRDMCCTEALILGYSTNESGFLEDQISLWLETDLPVYHWLHRVPAQRIEEHYLPFLKRCNRIVYDSRISGDAYANVRWRSPERVRDLAFARLLPFRQNLGHFLSGFAPGMLIEDLSSVTVRAHESLQAEARVLGEWMIRRLQMCARIAEKERDPSLKFEAAEEGRDDLQVEWGFTSHNRYFFWDYNERSRSGRVTCNLGNGRIEQTMHLEAMSPASAFAEALFF